ncbi:pyridoxal phosphate-dependent decarboxylase family protein [Ekhidna sp. To15]|uniref:pyridoxal phosphate-dependent decarboxylase family protein n=1 Tax=Ekhidna sp. To15 TaxID=3395267 RepID=UPI003F523414
MEHQRKTPIEISKVEFQKIGAQLVDSIADFIDGIGDRPVTTNKSGQELTKLIGTTSLPEYGTPVDQLLSNTSDILMDHSLHNGHPKFMGYITSSAAPIGMLADLLAAAVNPNVGANILSPIATEIEKQTIKWLSEMIGISPTYGGILVSGGNMANFTAFLAARTAKSSANFKENGFSNEKERMTVYCSTATHTWIDKAAVLFGLGTKAIKLIPTNDDNQMDIQKLEETIKLDIENGYKPSMVIGTAGDVSTGVVDNLKQISAISKMHNLWFHIDGAYGAPAAVVPRFKELFDGIEEADSIALDPHKWLYSPLEAGCTLVKDPKHLIDTYSAHPEYYNFNNESAHNFYEYGLQNSRGFRALKVWLALKQVGKKGYQEMINEDIALAEYMFEQANVHIELEAVTQNLSITTLRYIPISTIEKYHQREYLNKLNEEILNDLQAGGMVFLSNAMINQNYNLRACIVNYRTSKKDIEETLDIIVQTGRRIHEKLC